jgi:RNase P/RNase MRP subunit POP5
MTREDALQRVNGAIGVGAQRALVADRPLTPEGVLDCQREALADAMLAAVAAARAERDRKWRAWLVLLPPAPDRQPEQAP